MKTIKQIKEKMEEKGIKFESQRLQLGVKQEKGGVKSTGPHTVKILEEPKIGTGKDFMTGKERQELKFLLEEDGDEKTWSFPIYSKDGGPHYLLSRLENVEVGDEIVLEMVNKGGRSFIQVVQPTQDGVDIDYEDNQKDSSGDGEGLDISDF